MRHVDEMAAIRWRTTCLVNAARAIGPERGLIVVRSGDAGNEVWVEVEDNGSGIAPDKLARMFDPFLTTKPVGRGTGLGLSLAYGIVHKHHGCIDVHSKPGRGSCFRLTLPVRRPGAEGVGPCRRPPRPGRCSPSTTSRTSWLHCAACSAPRAGAS